MFEKIHLLMIHSAKDHPNQQQLFSCLLCPKRFGLKELLMKHSVEEHSGKMKSVEDNKPIQRQTSDFQSLSMAKYAQKNSRKEMAPIESPSANQPQEPIAALSNSKQVLIKESTVLQIQKKPSGISAGNWFCCKFCTATFSTKKQLVIHCEKQHNKVVPDKEILPIVVPSKTRACKICPEKFRLKRDLTMHLAQVHGQDVKKTSPPRAKNFACAQCTECFASKRSLIKHAEQRHHSKQAGVQLHRDQRLPKTFACALCPAAYEQINDLVIHSQNVHFQNKVADLSPINFDASLSGENHILSNIQNDDSIIIKEEELLYLEPETEEASSFQADGSLDEFNGVLNDAIAQHVSNKI